MKLISDLVFITVGVAAAWWLSGYDPRVTGEDPRADLIHRTIRVSITAVLVSFVMISGFLAIPTFVAVGIYWAHTGSEFGSQLFHKLLDPEDKRAFDPKETERNLDLLAQYVRLGHTREALELCTRLQAAGEASPLALDTQLLHLYQDTLDSISKLPALAESRRLRELGQCIEAEARLNSILAAEPENWAAMLLLMRLYAEDLAKPDKAVEFLFLPDKKNPRPCLHPAFVKYARHSVQEWYGAAMERKRKQNQPAMVGARTAAPAPLAVVEVSADDLLKNGQLTTAIELLENATREQPKNFEAWMKLAGAHAIYCADINRAGKVFRAMELSGNFTAEEIQQTRVQLREWHAARR